MNYENTNVDTVLERKICESQLEYYGIFSSFPLLNSQNNVVNSMVTRKWFIQKYNLL